MFFLLKITENCNSVFAKLRIEKNFEVIKEKTKAEANVLPYLSKQNRVKIF